MSRTGIRLEPEAAAELVRRIRAGDQSAWTELVDGYLGLLTATLRCLRLNDSDLNDVIQTTWLRLVQNIDRVEDPQRIAGWLMTTARREGLRILTQRHRTELTYEPDSLDRIDERLVDCDQTVIAAERDDSVRRLVSELPPRCRELLQQLFEEPRLAYEQISETLQMPIGSIGPTRARCLTKLRALADAAGVDLRELAHS